MGELQQESTLLVEDGNHGEYRPRRDEFVDSGGTSFIRATDLANGRVNFESASQINEVALRRIRKGVGAPGDVLLSHKGTVGKVALVPADAPDFVCSPQTTIWRALDSDKLDRRYLFHYLQGPDFAQQLRSRQSETDMAAYVSLTTQRTLEVVTPPLDVQRSIAVVLGALDDRIDVNVRIAADAEALAQAEFRSFLQNGEDVVELSSVAAVTMGSSPPGNTYNEVGEGLPFFQGTRDFGFRYPSRRVYCTDPKRTADARDVLVSVRAPVGRVNVAVEKCVIGRGVAALSSETPACVLQALRVSAAAWEPYEAEGTVFGSINAKALKALQIRWPKASAAELELQIAPLDALVVRRLKENERLVELRDTLLPKLLSGELRVEEAEELAQVWS